jgi:transcriptional activator SPT7
LARVNGNVILSKFGSFPYRPVLNVHSSSPNKMNRRSPKKLKHKKVKTEKQTLLGLMDSNITTVRRLRTAHNKYARLIQDTKDTTEGGDRGDTGVSQSQGSVDTNATFESEATTLVDEPAVYKHSKERPWKVRGGVEGKEARACMHWMCGKVLEHSTFQGEHLF